MGRSSAPGLHARPALLIAVGVALMFARIWGPAGEDATRLAFVVLLAATLGNLLVAIVVVHKASTEIVENPTDTVVGEPAGVEMSITGLRSAVSVRMRSSPDATVGHGASAGRRVPPRRRAASAASPRVPRSRCARGDRSASSATPRSRLIDLRRTLWIGPRPVALERADRPRASHPALCPPGQSSPRARATSREACGSTCRAIRFVESRGRSRRAPASS